MNITLLTTQKFLPPLVGGVDVYTYRLGKALSAMGHTIQIVALNPGVANEVEPFSTEQDELDGFPVTRILFSFADRPKEAFDYGYDAEMGQAVKSILQEQQPHLFIVVNFYMITLSAVLVANELGIPVFHVATDFLPICRRATFIRWNNVSCQLGESIKSCSACFVSHNVLGRVGTAVLNTLPESTLTKLARNRDQYALPNPLAAMKPYWNQVAIMEQRLRTLSPLRAMIDHVFVPTQFTRKMFVENGFDTRRVHHVPFGVDPNHPLTQVERTPSDHVRFLFIGRFQPYKGAHLLIEAFNKLANPKGATLTFYGGSDGHEDYYERLQQMMAQNERIRFLGKIDPADLAQAFADADYFILPSTWHENMPLITLDALQSHTPLISSDIGGVTDVIKHDVNGLLFPMGDVSALQATLQRTIDDPTLVDKLSAGVDLMTIDKYAEAMLAYLPEPVEH
ncbi:MAG: glycosyltransferase [Anaerolineales bacterium]|nr:glycosyltransferase [Anaerolineales bacterium]MCA9927223.1 glycosyltransferase [Anaerolineales bacterium]